ncbi:MAG TPA: outer membrane beta-barrel protein [Sphingobacteriaceae bacterium]|nr:outer membrane beta-barrel protein [Sphingobacteriaceae bacterium]
MKNILLTLFCSLVALSASAQDTIKNDSTRRVKVITDRDTIEMKVGNDKKKVEIIFEMGDESIDHNLETDTIPNRPKGDKKTSSPIPKVKKSKFFSGLTFSRFDLGLAKMLDHGKGNLSSENEFLDYRSWKSVNVGFDVVQMGYKFHDQFRVVVAAGFDWTHFRLKNNVIITEGTPLGYENSDIDYKKNRFSSSYLRIPLTFEVKSKAGAFPHRLKFAGGPIAGVLIQGSQKFKSKEEGKRKNKDDFNYMPFRYGAFARIGYNGFGLFAKYYFNDMFQDSPDQIDLKSLSFGVTLFL